MPTFPNPALHEIYQRDIVTLWEAARAIGVKPGTLRVWESRGKIERVSAGDGIPLYHLPTLEQAVQVKPGRPKAA